MIDLSLLRTDPEVVRASQRARGADPSLVDVAADADAARRAEMASAEALRAEQKVLGRQVARAAGDERAALLERTRALAARVKEAGAAVEALTATFEAAVGAIPNVVADGVPPGGEDDYAVLREVGVRPDLPDPADHLALGEALGAIDTARGAKVSGARFYFLTGVGAMLELALGRAIVIAFADAGADVAIGFAPAADAAFGRPDAAADAAREVEARGRRAECIAADLGLPGEGRRAVEEASRRLGGLDVLVVCASIQQRTPFDAVTPEETERQIRINFTATIELLQAALPPMRERGWGRVLAIGSINQTRPEAELAVYAALKSAQHNLVLNLARQYAPHGVTVNNLSPGLVATERNRWRRADAESWAAIQKDISPMGRAGTPEEMAGAALLLCSEAGSFITGADLQATGGGHL